MGWVPTYEQFQAHKGHHAYSVGYSVGLANIFHGVSLESNTQLFCFFASLYAELRMTVCCSQGKGLQTSFRPHSSTKQAAENRPARAHKVFGGYPSTTGPASSGYPMSATAEVSELGPGTFEGKEIAVCRVGYGARSVASLPEDGRFWPVCGPKERQQEQQPLRMPPCWAARLEGGPRGGQPRRAWDPSCRPRLCASARGALGPEGA